MILQNLFTSVTRRGHFYSRRRMTYELVVCIRNNITDLTSLTSPVYVSLYIVLVTSGDGKTRTINPRALTGSGKIAVLRDPKLR